jgi:DNA topoisomerase-1
MKKNICSEDKIINPKTNRCVSLKGKIGQQILKNNIPKNNIPIINEPSLKKSNMRNLCLVESSGKTQIIQKYLNSIPELKSLGTFKVSATLGHLREILKKNGIEVDNDFKINYGIIDSKKKVIENLRREIKDADMIYLASDNDREGESIANAIKDIFKLKKYKRIIFNEITKDALKIAILNPTEINNDIVAAQETRAILDQIVGFKLTQCLWKNFKSNTTISTGRCMSPTLKIIVEKETEISDFESTKYYKLSANFLIKNITVKDAILYNNTTIFKIESDDLVKKYMDTMIKNNNEFYIKTLDCKDISEKAPLPFITSSLQIEASSKLHLSIKQVMSLAQKLYESGKITYMRTDSYNISETAHNNIHNYIVSKFGEEFYKKNIIKKKSKNSQEAHECIRVTDPLIEICGLNNDHQKLYELIHKRTIASQMKPAIYKEGSVIICNKKLEDNLYFLGKLKILINPGYLKVYNINVDQKDIDNLDLWLDTIKNSKNIELIELNANTVWTSPPSRYSEATLIKELEKLGIGRPSTYSNIMTKLYDRKYVEKKDIYGEKFTYTNYIYTQKLDKIKETIEKKELYNEKSKLVPTDGGEKIYDFLEKNFSEIIDVNYTSNMELSLDKIALGDLEKLKFLNKFYKHFQELLQKTIKNDSKKSLIENEVNLVIDVNGKKYTVRRGKYGPLIESTDDDNKKNFINLKPYLTITKKNLEDIKEKDVKFLIKFPVLIGNKNNTDIYLYIGPYGFYLKVADKNIKIPFNVKKNIMQMTSYNSLLEYVV